MVEMPKYVRDTLEALTAAGYEAWCVGGCVRDSLLGRIPEDWDVATSAAPEETLALFPDRAFPTGIRHGTVTVRIEGHPVEITTFRVDGAYHDHRRPETVTFTRSLEEDLKRRDFTVNAIAVGLDGTLRDPFGGRADLKSRTLRCVGDPEKRFQEDALRILRGLRFAAVLGFSIEPETAAAMCRNQELLRKIAPERIWTELQKLLCGDYAADALRASPEIMGVYWPEVLPMVGFDQRNHHHCFDVWEHTLRALKVTEPDVILRCTMLLHDVGKPICFTLDEKGSGHFYGHPAVSARMAEEMLSRLRCSGAVLKTVTRLVAWHDRFIPQTERGIRRALRVLGEEDLRRLLAVKRADNLAQAPAYHGRQTELDLTEALLNRLLAEDACFTLRQLAVKGQDLAALGYMGPALGRALDTLLGAVVDGEVPNNRSALLKYIRNHPDSKGEKDE